MTDGPLRSLVDYLRRLTGGGDDPHSDGQLLERFVATQDETAFAALVQRYGPMVWGVCRRVLRHEQDVEDAFQATFLAGISSQLVVWRRQAGRGPRPGARAASSSEGKPRCDANGLWNNRRDSMGRSPNSPR